MPKSEVKTNNLIREYIARILIPSLVVVVIINLVIRNPDQNNSQESIDKAILAHNYAGAFERYAKLIEEDFSNLENHRGYLRCQQKMSSRSETRGKQDSWIIDKYVEYSKSEDENISNIGFYGLGFFYSLRDNHTQALEYFQQIKNPSMVYLNNSIGFVYLMSKNYEKAKLCFHKEIEMKGNVSAAYGNLAKVLYEEKDYTQLNELVSNPEVRNYLPRKIIRITHLKNGRVVNYLRDSFRLDYVTATGFLAAGLVLLIWFQYLRSIDVFEPEKLRYLLLVLLGGMLISTLCTLLYDYYSYSLGMDSKGNWLHELTFCVFGIGLIEETVKIVPFLLMLRYSQNINESIDYVVYASVSALGFAFMENLSYFQDPGLTSILPRALLCVLGHMSYSSIAVYGLVYAKYRKNNQHRILWFMISFGVACVVHGMYDFWLISDNTLPEMKMFSLIIKLFCVVVFSKIIKNALNQSEYNESEKWKIEHLTKYLVYSLTIVFLLQYTLIALKFGPVNANASVGKMGGFYIVLLLVIIGNLGRLDGERHTWVPLLQKRKHNSQ